MAPTWCFPVKSLCVAAWGGGGVCEDLVVVLLSEMVVCEASLDW